MTKADGELVECPRCHKLVVMLCKFSSYRRFLEACLECVVKEIVSELEAGE